jgi:hypothetical protein
LRTRRGSTTRPQLRLSTRICVWWTTRAILQLPATERLYTSKSGDVKASVGRLSRADGYELDE